METRFLSVLFFNFLGLITELMEQTGALTTTLKGISEMGTRVGVCPEKWGEGLLSCRLSCAIRPHEQTADRL